jgi:hypothetical protein
VSHGSEAAAKPQANMIERQTAGAVKGPANSRIIKPSGSKKSPEFCLSMM